MEEFISEESVNCNADERFLGTMEVMFMELGNLEPPSSNYCHVNVLHQKKKLQNVMSEKVSMNSLNRIFYCKQDVC